MKTNLSKKSAPVLLCGTDFSPNARQAADVACALAKRLEVPLELVHASEIPAYPATTQMLHDEAVRLRQKGIGVHESLLVGNPDEELVKRAKAKSCRLVVVSSLGKRPLKRWLLGSVSERTAERAPVPTLVVRDAAPFEAWVRGERPLKVFVAFNFTATAEAALKWVSFLQAIGPCEVVVSYVDFPLEQRGRLGGTGPIPLVGNLPEVQSVLERDLGARVTELLGTADFRICVEANWGRPDAALAALAKQQGADLIVVGSHQYQGFERFWNLSVSSGLLRGAAMSVAVVPFASPKKRVTSIAPAVRRVIVSTDFSVLGNHAIPHAYSLLRGGGTLHLLHVAHPHEMPGGEYLNGPISPGFRTLHAKHLLSCANRLRALIPPESVGMGITTEVEVAEHENAATAICQAAERIGADAVCCATHGLSGLSKTLMGSVAQKVLARNTRPLLLIRSMPDA